MMGVAVGVLVAPTGVLVGVLVTPTGVLVGVFVTPTVGVGVDVAVALQFGPAIVPAWYPTAIERTPLAMVKVE